MANERREAFISLINELAPGKFKHRILQLLEAIEFKSDGEEKRGEVDVGPDHDHVGGDGAPIPINQGTLGILNVFKGGTGTGTQFTPGSVVFAGGGGVYTQDNSNFFWDNSNKRLGINAGAAPSHTLEVVGSASNRTPIKAHDGTGQGVAIGRWSGGGGLVKAISNANAWDTLLSIQSSGTVQIATTDTSGANEQIISYFTRNWGGYPFVRIAGALAVGNANPPKGGGRSLDCYGSVFFNGSISPSQITSDQNDYDPSGGRDAAVFRLTSDAERSITGIHHGVTTGYGDGDGRVLILENVGSYNIMLSHNSASSSSGYRFYCPGGVTYRLKPNTAAVLVYDGTSTHWRVTSAAYDLTDIRVGDQTTNYTTWNSSGHQTMVGTAKPWDDLRIEPTVRNTGVNNPVSEKWYDDSGGTSRGVYLYSFTDEGVANNEKEIGFTMQMPHSWDGGDVHLHVHWVGSVDDTTAAPRWGLEYTWKDVGQVFGDTTIVYSDGNNYTDTGTDADITANKHYISKFDALTPGSTADNISSILIGRLFRNSSDAGDTYDASGNKCGLLYIDAHFQLARIGSDEEYTA